MENVDIPDVWWGPGFWWGQSQPRSVAELMAGGTLDARLAALLWVAIHRHMSLVVVGGHAQGVGKTTLLTALMAFLAPGVTPVFTTGPRDPLAFAGQTEPARTRIMVNELSDHTPFYLWGRAAARVFDLVGQGYAMAATMHAESLEELVGQTEDPAVGVSRRTFVDRVPLAVLLAALRRKGRLVRRVTSVVLLRRDDTAELGVRSDRLSTWDSDEDTYRFTDQPELWPALAARLGLSQEELREESDARQAYLTALNKEGVRNFDAVREAILRYR